MNRKENNNLENMVYNIIIQTKCIVQQDAILVAVSGGPDSMALLNVLLTIRENYNLNYAVGVAHVNHGLREESKEEEIYVQDFCKQKNVPFYSLQVDVAKQASIEKIGIEECGRNIRYNFFNKLAKEQSYTKIAIAHNQNDKVETILMNLIRGCSTKGLIGMNIVTDNVIRPLLETKKEDILNYCQQNNLKPRHDKSNDSMMYARNRVRLELVPLLERNYNSNISQSILRLSKLASLEQEFFNDYISSIFYQIVLEQNENKIKIDCLTLIKEKEVIQNKCIIYLLNILLGDVQGIEKKHIEDMITLIKKNITGKRYIIGNKFMLEITEKNKAVFTRKREGME